MIVPLATLVGAGIPEYDERGGNGVIVVAVVNGRIPIVALEKFAVMIGATET